MSAPASTSSPRSAEEPMAFSAGELWRGLAFAWCIFMVLLMGYLLIMMIVEAATTPSGSADASGWLVLLFLVIVASAGAWALGAALLGAPVAWLVGRSLRRVRQVPVHLLVYAAFGAVIAVVAVLILNLDDGALWHEPGFQWFIGAAATLAVPLAWWFTLRLALRADRRAVATAQDT